jgi:hypothetical protein
VGFWSLNVEASDSGWATRGLVDGTYSDFAESGMLSMENTGRLTVAFDLVNPDGEIVRVRYRLCRPDSA